MVKRLSKSQQRSRRFFLTATQSQRKFYYFYVRISSIKVFSLLITSIGEATGINCEYLLNILLILIWCILKLGTFISRLISSVLYWYAVKNKVSFKPINNYLTVSYYYITTDQDDVRNSRHALPYRCRRERAQIAKNCINTNTKTWK